MMCENKTCCCDNREQSNGNEWWRLELDDTLFSIVDEDGKHWRTVHRNAGRSVRSFEMLNVPQVPKSREGVLQEKLQESIYYYMSSHTSRNTQTSR